MRSVIRHAACTIAICIAPICSFAQDKGSTPPAAASATSAKPAIDPRAMELLKQNQEAMMRLNAYQADCIETVKRYGRSDSPKVLYHFSSVVARRPDMDRFLFWDVPGPLDHPPAAAPAGHPALTIVSDGKAQWREDGTKHTYDVTTLGGTVFQFGPARYHTITLPFEAFFTDRHSAYGSAKLSAAHGELAEVSIVGQGVVDGVQCVHVHTLTSTVSRDLKKTNVAEEWWLGPDHMVRRLQMRYDPGDRTSMETDYRVVNIKLNGSPPVDTFVYYPPTGVVEDTGRNEAGVLPPGTRAPDFAVRTVDGKTVRLSDLRSSIVVLDFWETTCGPCMASMPENNRVVAKLRAAGVPVVMLAVDDWDKHADFYRWCTTKGAAYPDLRFTFAGESMEVSSKLYKVAGVPTRFVIDESGVIRSSITGYGGPGDDLENDVRAALK